MCQGVTAMACAVWSTTMWRSAGGGCGAIVTGAARVRTPAYALIGYGVAVLVGGDDDVADAEDEDDDAAAVRSVAGTKHGDDDG